jgi:hypothetical protein
MIAPDLQMRLVLCLDLHVLAPCRYDLYQQAATQ